MKNWVILFLLLLAAGIAFGIGRDLYSREVRVVKGTVVSFSGNERDYKSPIITTPKYSVRLEDGQVVDVATTDAKGLAPGSAIDVIELLTPWGQAWYKKSQN